jgi:hypothetical protein
MLRTAKPDPRRDEELGAALRELEVPDHRPGFYPKLYERMAEAGTDFPSRRRAAARRAPARWGLRVAAVAAVVAIVVVAIGIPETDRTPRIGPEPATAAEIKAKVRAALATVSSLGGTVIADGSKKADEKRWSFLLTAEGDFRLEGPSDGEVITYDASNGVTHSAQRSASFEGGPIFYSVRRGIAPGLPDGGPPTWVIPDSFGAFVRALLAANDPRIAEVTYNGRPAWRLTVDAVRNAIVPEFTGDGFEIIVDRETGLPVRVLETQDGAFLREIRIENLVVNPEIAPGAFEPSFPTNAEVMRMDEGFQRVSLEEVSGVVGYAPLVPVRIPSGYELAEVAVARKGGGTGVEAANPHSRMVVSLSYRRGLDQFLVTTRLGRATAEGEPALPLEKLWGDPLATGEGYVDEKETIVVEGGALDGETAELVLVPRGIPHLWALTDDLVVTVGGDLSRSELIRVTESLQARS